MAGWEGWFVSDPFTEDADMSRGPGKWQRRILEKLAEEPRWYTVMELQTEPRWYNPTNNMSQYQAIRRAARRLADQGKIRYQRMNKMEGFMVGPIQ